MAVNTRMSRVEKFKEIRSLRKKYASIFVLFTLLMVVGVCVADYSVNNLMQNRKQIEILSLKSLKDSFIEINFMNQKWYINTSYISRDYKKLKSTVDGWFHVRETK